MTTTFENKEAEEEEVEEEEVVVVEEKEDWRQTSGHNRRCSHGRTRLSCWHRFVRIQ